MTTKIESKNFVGERSSFPIHGWLGLGILVLFWILNWTLSGARTHWGFFPLWLGSCLADGYVSAEAQSP